MAHTSKHRRHGKGAGVYKSGVARGQPESGEVAEVEVQALGGLGDGIARLATGEVVLVRDGVPGDRAQVAIDRSQRPPRARIIALLAPSPDRVVPRCPVAMTCGGCSWQHVSGAVQADQKRQMAQRALGLDALLLVAPVPAFGHRRRVRLHLRRTATGLAAGFLARASTELCATAACPVLVPALEALVARAPSILGGWIEQGELLATAGAEGAIAVLHGRALPGIAAPTVADAERMAAALHLAGLDLHLQRHHARWGLRTVTLAETFTPLTPHGMALPVTVDAGGFSQATEAGNTAIRAAVARELADIAPSASAFEAFAGSGNLSALLVGHVPRLTTVELDAAAVARARTTLTGAAELGTTVAITSGDAGDSARRQHADLWLLDPGRPGAREVCEAAEGQRPQHLIYVSCAPDTFARDRKLLEAAGYRVASASALDTLPHTPHLELVVRFALQVPDPPPLAQLGVTASLHSLRRT